MSTSPETAGTSQLIADVTASEGTLGAGEQKIQKKKKKKKKSKEEEKKKDEKLGTTRGIETMFRTSYQTHNALSAS